MKVIQPSFASGELSPSLHARVDLAKYHVGAARMRNFLVDFRGGASSRPGTRYIGRTKFTTATRLIKFQFSTVQTYVLEFGNLYIRFIMNGGYILETAKNITGLTTASPGVFTSVAHGFVVGQWVYVDGIVGITALNQKFYIVGTVPTADTFTLTNLSGDAINTTGLGTYSSGGTASRVYEIVTPYLADDLAKLKWTQSADVMTLVHPSYAPRNLSRTGHTAWTLSTITFGATLAAPINVEAAMDGTGTIYSYVITAVSEEGDESLPSTDAGNAFGSVWTAGDPTSMGRSVTVTWDAVTGAAYYNIYRAPIAAGETTIPSGTIYQYVGSTDGTEFFDWNITADAGTAPPSEIDVFDAANDYPGSVTYFQQRRVFARTNDRIQTLWMSQTGSFNNFNTSRPTRDTDAITATINSLQANEIKHMIPMPEGLILLTGGSAFSLGGGEGQAVTPSNIIVKQQSFTGVSDVRPVVVGQDILYVQAAGSTVRDMSFNYLNSIYTGADISTLSSHLFYGRQIISWDWAEEPLKIIWAVRDDGTLLSLTFLKEQEVMGWAWHDTQGTFRDVCVVTEGSEDVPYFITRRRIGGTIRQIVERMESRILTGGVESTWAVDCGLSTSPTYPGASLVPGVITGANTITLRSGSAVFTGGDVGKHVRAGGGKILITAFVSSTEVTGAVLRPITEVTGTGIPLIFDAGEWSISSLVSTISGLDHLEGQVVKVLADGRVETKTVTNGVISLTNPASMVRVGLGYTCQLQTLPLDIGEPTIQATMKKPTRLTVRVFQTRGLYAGQTFATVKAIPETPNPIATEPTELISDDYKDFILDPSWNTKGQICLQQVEPLPVTVLGVIPDVRVAKGG